VTFEHVVFYLFAIIMVFAAVRVITASNPVHAAMFLVLTFFTCSGIWLLLEAEFLAVTLVLVYVGAVMVLFLFVVMMLDINTAPLREGFVKYLPVGLLVGVIMLVEMVFLITQRFFQSENFPAPARADADFSNTEFLGRLLYDEYLPVSIRDCRHHLVGCHRCRHCADHGYEVSEAIGTGRSQKGRSLAHCRDAC